MKRLSPILILSLLLSLTAISLAFADEGDRYRDDSLSVCGPGYLNAAKYQAEAIMRQQSPNKGLLQSIIDYVQSNNKNKVETAKADKESTKPELKQKMSGPGRKADALSSGSFNLAAYNIKIGDAKIGTGDKSSQVYDSQGRLVSEKINGVTQRYVGFGYAGTDTIAEAMLSSKAGDTLFINAGSYHENINVRDGVKIYGIDAPTLYGTFNLTNISNAEIAGFTITGPGTGVSGGIGINIDNSTGDHIWGNDIKSSYDGILVNASSAILVENNMIRFNANGIDLESGSATFNNNAINNNSVGFKSGSNISDTILNDNAFLANVVDINSSRVNTTPVTPPLTVPKKSANTESTGSTTSTPTIMTTAALSLPNSVLLSSLGGTNTSSGIRVLTFTGNLFSSSSTSFLQSSYMTWSGNVYLTNGITSIVRDITTGIYNLSTVSGVGINSQYTGYSKLEFTDNFQARSEYSLGLTNLRTATGSLSSATVANIEGIYHDAAFGASDYSSKSLGGALSAMLAAKGLGEDSSKSAAGNAALNAMDDALAHAIMMAAATSLSSKNLEGENAPNIEEIVALANIIEHPTEDQKVILDVVKSVLADSAKLQDGVTSPELKKAQDDLLNAAAKILLAQAMPGMIEGDMANIKAIFSELNTQKNRILAEYDKSVKPYYENIARDMAKNMSALQLNNILRADMTKDELEKLPPSEIDKIIAKMIKRENKAFEVEYMLQQEAKYRKTILDPNKTKLEEAMKNMLKEFTGRINNTLKSTDKK